MMIFNNSKINNSFLIKTNNNKSINEKVDKKYVFFMCIISIIAIKSIFLNKYYLNNINYFAVILFSFLNYIDCRHGKFFSMILLFF